MARTRAYLKTGLMYSRKWRRLRSDDRARLLYLVIHISPSGNSVGCYHTSINYLMAELNWGGQQVQEGIDTLSEARLIDWNADEEVVRIVGFVKHDPPVNVKHAKSLAMTAISLPDCVQKTRVIKDLLETAHGKKIDELHTELDRVSIPYPDLEAVERPYPYPNPRPLPKPLPTPKPDSCAKPPEAPSAPALPKDNTPPAVTETPVVFLPTNQAEIEVPIFQSQIDDYARTYPAVDVHQQIRAMRRWLIDNPAQRKTKKGMASFVNRWLSREQDKGPRERTNGSAGAVRATALDNLVEGAQRVMERRHGPDKPH